MAKLMTKSELIEKVAAAHSELSKKDVKGIMETPATGAYKARNNGAFLLPSFAKFVVIKKPATKEREGINPFTKEPTMFKARQHRGYAYDTRGRGKSKTVRPPRLFQRWIVAAAPTR